MKYLILFGLLTLFLISCRTPPYENLIDENDSQTLFPTSDKNREFQYTRKALSIQEQDMFLKRRTGASVLEIGTFDNICSLLYVLDDICIHSDCPSQELENNQFLNVFPDYYKPTIKELFDVIAQQTLTSWSYDEKRDYWVFNVPQAPLVYNITIAPGWISENRGIYIYYAPSIAPVGMDIYLLGHYTPEENQDELYTKVRNTWALKFIKPILEEFNINISEGDMEEVELSNTEALYLEMTLPNTIVWRQWFFVSDGYLFGIVSAIKEDLESVILPDVLKMVNSFNVVKKIINNRQLPTEIFVNFAIYPMAGTIN